MHNKILMYDSSYEIIKDSPKDNSDKQLSQETEKIITQKTVANEKKQDIRQNKNTSQKASIDRKTTNIPTTQKQKTTATIKIEPEKTITQTPKTIQKIDKTQVQTQTPKQTEAKTLAQQEEEIAWNIWRSNLQNQIMKDVKLPYIPKGTIFKFSFDVDKYGRISNIQTWSLNSNYTPYAIQYIAPVIKSYQGKDILDFPAGTQRLTTKFTGGWKIADNAIYSTPNDYNDIEKVKK